MNDLQLNRTFQTPPPNEISSFWFEADTFLRNTKKHFFKEMTNWIIFFIWKHFPLLRQQKRLEKTALGAANEKTNPRLVLLNKKQKRKFRISHPPTSFRNNNSEMRKHEMSRHPSHSNSHPPEIPRKFAEMEKKVSITKWAAFNTGTVKIGKLITRCHIFIKKLWEMKSEKCSFLFYDATFSLKRIASFLLDTHEKVKNIRICDGVDVTFYTIVHK